MAVYLKQIRGIQQGDNINLTTKKQFYKKTDNPKYRNMMLSFKSTAEEKIMLKCSADKYDLTVSEFLYTTVMHYHNQYEYICLATFIKQTVV